MTPYVAVALIIFSLGSVAFYFYYNIRKEK